MGWDHGKVEKSTALWVRDETSFCEFIQRPTVFRNQLVHHTPMLEPGGHDLPGVGFHFKMRTQARICL